MAELATVFEGLVELCDLLFDLGLGWGEFFQLHVVDLGLLPFIAGGVDIGELEVDHGALIVGGKLDIFGFFEPFFSFVRTLEVHCQGAFDDVVEGAVCGVKSVWPQSQIEALFCTDEVHFFQELCCALDRSEEDIAERCSDEHEVKWQSIPKVDRGGEKDCNDKAEDDHCEFDIDVDCEHCT